MFGGGSHLSKGLLLLLFAGLSCSSLRAESDRLGERDASEVENDEPQGGEESAAPLGARSSASEHGAQTETVKKAEYEGEERAADTPLEGGSADSGDESAAAEPPSSSSRSGLRAASTEQRRDEPASWAAESSEGSRLGLLKGLFGHRRRNWNQNPKREKIKNMNNDKKEPAAAAAGASGAASPNAANGTQIPDKVVQAVATGVLRLTIREQEKPKQDKSTESPSFWWTMNTTLRPEQQGSPTAMPEPTAASEWATSARPAALPTWSPSPPPAHRSSRAPAKPAQQACNCPGQACSCEKEMRDSDRLLAVVITRDGAFKGRRLSVKAIEDILRSKLSGQQMADLEAKKPVLVSPNNTFVFPAGRYYFPSPMRVVGFASS